MNEQMKAAHTKALVALNAAKAIRDEFKATGVTAEKKVEFDAYMADFATANDEYHALKTQQEQFSALDSGLELYTAPSGEMFSGPAGTGDLSGAVPTSVEEALAIKARHHEAFHRFLTFGAQGLDRAEMGAYLAGPQQLFGNNPQETLGKMLPAEQHALVGTVDNLGGFLVPDEFMSELIVELAGFAVMRPMARVRQTSRSSATFLTVAGSGNNVYPSGVSGSFRQEGWVIGGNNLPTQNQPRFGRERVPVHIWSPDIIELTMELLEDAAINLDAEIRSLLAETRALDEDSTFINGTGVGMPTGILTEIGLGNIVEVQSGIANGQTYEGLVNMWSSLASQYRGRASWLMNSVTLGALALLEDDAGNPIFPTNEIPTNLFQRPIAVSEFMPDGSGAGTDGNNAIVFGDFSFYGIADRMDMRILRLVERFAPNIGLMAIARVGGQVLKTNPFRAQSVGV